MKKGSQLIMFCILNSINAFGQNDSTYYETHNDVMHGRLSLIQKYNVLHYKSAIEQKSAKYFPHILPGVGIGFTYDWVTFNLSYGLRFNGREREKGKTRYLDIQLHASGKKAIIDVFAQIYKGLYVPGDKDADGNFYHRPDLETRLIGGSYQYVVNNKRFSFRSSFLQTDWQKKSAGSLLIGLEAYVGRISADSSLLPFSSDADRSSNVAKKYFFWQAGPILGYAYTVVIKKHIFITGSLAESLNFGRQTMTNDLTERSTWKLITNPSYRVSAGYNTYRWGMSIFYINNRVKVPGTLSGDELALSSGTFRINFVYRLQSKGRLGYLIDKI